MAMEHTLDGELRNLKRQTIDFAVKNIATRTELSSSPEFPMDLWHALGSASLLGIGIRKDIYGKGLGYPGIYTAGKALARHGCCLGITLSWLMHQITARFFLDGCATFEQKQRYLPGMANGAITTSIAISETGVGGHPKHLKTFAEKTDQGYLLTGEKAYLTNGPIADLFIVLAINGQEGERKQYTAFLVPKDSPGLLLSDPLDFGFLRPCPHGGIILRKCFVPEHNIFGTPDKAYETMAMPFREIEDAMMMGPIVGAQEARLNEIVKTFKDSTAPVIEDNTYLLGGISSTLEALDLIAYDSAQRLEDGNDPAGLAPLIIAFRRLNLQVHRELGEVVASSNMSASKVYQNLTHDLDHIGRFAGGVSRLKQIKLGEALISSS